MKKYLAFFILCILVLSCQESDFYIENKIIKNRSWEYSQIPEFKVNIGDAKAKYDIYIYIRHTNFYPYTNISTIVHVNSQRNINSTLENNINLVTKTNQWTGKNTGILYEVEYKLKEDFIFPDTGNYIFSIEQNMKDNPLKEINDIGIKIIKK